MLKIKREIHYLLLERVEMKKIQANINLQIKNLKNHVNTQVKKIKQMQLLMKTSVLQVYLKDYMKNQKLNNNLNNKQKN